MFHTSSVGAYLASYGNALQVALSSVDGAALDRARVLIEKAADVGRRIYAIGNGGSAAIADHLCCDLTKGTHVTGQPVIDSQSLCANVPLYTAIANDFGFDKVFSTQLTMIGRPGDVLLAISSSGNSANIVAGVTTAREIGMSVIGLSGFSGGALRETADVALHVDANNYGLVEDAHQAIMHVLAQYIALHRD